MNDIINKITSYNLFNYLLPGVLYSISVNHFTRLQLPIENVLEALFVCYFIGLMISRMGALIVKPILVKLTYLPKELPYNKFLDAEQKDSKISILSQEGNVYRTLIALGLSIILSIGIDKLLSDAPISNVWIFCILVVLLIVLFIYAYVRQSRFLSERIHNNLK